MSEGAMRLASRGHKLAPDHLAVKRLVADEGRWVIVPVSELRMVFLGSVAIAQRLAFTDYKPEAFRPHRLYVRTGGGVYLTGFRSVAECLSVLAADGFVLCFESVVIHLRHLAWIEDRGTQRLAGVRVGVNNGTECVPVSRRHLRGILGRLGVHLRRRRIPDHDEMD
jgi:hypothetical protein